MLEPLLYPEATIFVDMDNTLTDYYGDFMRLCKSFYGSRIKEFKPHEEVDTISTVKWLVECGVDVKDAYKMKKVIYSIQSFWTDMTPMPDALRVFEYLYKNADVYILTSAFASGSDECLVGKRMWVSKHLPFFDIAKLIYCHHKNRIIGDYFIDDMNWIFDDRNKVITMDYPYNRNTETKYRVKNWKEIEELFILRR